MRAANGFHARSWNPQWDPRGSLSLFVYKLLPGLTLPGVWEETITASLHSQIILQLGTARTLNGFFGFIAIFGTTLQEGKKKKLMTRRLTNKIEICLMVSPLCLGDAAY